MRPFIPIAVLFTLAAVPRAASAQTADTVSYAIVVGSNAAGPGQESLQYAERDARRVASVLEDLGGYDADHVSLVLGPTPEKLEAAIDAVAAHLQDDAAAGKKTQVFFYYSGHARAAALDLGPDELALTDLRARLTALPATLTIVVLDACQSGAFTRVKGSEKTADFSYNSKSGLDASGIAVMASSSESELSQESDFLEGSYFTHHLLIGLRGGGDANHDGRVSLDEAYQYAYQQTLIATEQTAVGGQHVSLEEDLQGHGEVPLTYPEKADATLTLARDLAGDVLVEKLPAEAVLAEVHKEAGATFDVAIPSGKYKVLIREASVVERCSVTVPDQGNASVDGTGCDEMPLAITTAKGPGPGLRHRISVGLAFAGPVDDAFSHRLQTAFEYQRQGLRTALTAEDAITIPVPHLDAFVRGSYLAGEKYTRGITDFMPLTFQADSIALTFGARARYGEHHIQVWAEAGAGPIVSFTHFTDESGKPTGDTYALVNLEGGAGLTWYPFSGERLGFDLDGRLVYAPSVKDLIGDRMNVGGLFIGLGISYRTSTP